MQVYFDNAATTPLDPDVFEAMRPYLTEHYGNPSSTHSHGRKARAAVESARKQIAMLLNASPGEIFFTSGGTEADNTILRCATETFNFSHAITSPIEHHAVLHTLENLEQTDKLNLTFVELDEKGHVDLNHLHELLKKNPHSLVSIMHANNEVGNINDIQQIGILCKEYEAFFHSDTVQTIGHYKHDLSQLKVDGLAAAAHKFHGPKGVGFMFIRKGSRVNPLIFGGAQERNMRGGTENVPGIMGLAKALEIANQNIDEHHRYIQGLKDRMIERLKANIPGVSFHGDSENSERSLYTVLNVCLPPSEDKDMLLFNLDLKGISASGGSACSSGTTTGSHVLTSLKADTNRPAVRFSFSKFNKAEEVDYVVDTLAELYKEQPV